MKVMLLFGFFTVRPAWTETAGSVSVRACPQEAGEREFLLHGAGRIGLAVLREKIIIGSQQWNSTFQFSDSVLGTQRLEKSKDFRLHFSANFCPGWGHQTLRLLTTFMNLTDLLMRLDCQERWWVVPVLAAWWLGGWETCAGDTDLGTCRNISNPVFHCLASAQTTAMLDLKRKGTTIKLDWKKRLGLLVSLKDCGKDNSVA